jgi:hypothetical protein
MAIRQAKDNSVKLILGNHQLFVDFIKDFRYPPVIPIVFYDGPALWTAKLNFRDRVLLPPMSLTSTSLRLKMS